jgi:hypothetical protein
VGIAELLEGWAAAGVEVWSGVTAVSCSSDSGGCLG